MDNTADAILFANVLRTIEMVRQLMTANGNPQHIAAHDANSCTYADSAKAMPYNIVP